MVARPRFVFSTEVSDESIPFGAHGSIFPQVGQLGKKRVSSRLAPHLVQLNLVDQAPLRMLYQALSGVIGRRQLPFVAGEDEARQLASGTPHLVQSLEVLVEKLRCFIDDNEIIGQHNAHGFHQRLVEKECSVTRV